jgi:hypothetical protein
MAIWRTLSGRLALAVIASVRSQIALPIARLVQPGVPRPHQRAVLALDLEGVELLAMPLRISS